MELERYYQGYQVVKETQILEKDVGINQSPGEFI